MPLWICLLSLFYKIFSYLLYMILGLVIWLLSKKSIVVMVDENHKIDNN